LRLLLDGNQGTPYLRARWRSSLTTPLQLGGTPSAARWEFFGRSAGLGGSRAAPAEEEKQDFSSNRVSSSQMSNVGFNKLKCAIRRAACLRKITPNLELLNPTTCRPHLEYLYICTVQYSYSSGV
jgi:hypothetical protein